MRHKLWRMWCRCRSYFIDDPPRLHKYYSYPGDESGVRRNTRLDLPALIRAEATFVDDEFLDNVIRPCLHRFSGEEAHAFIQEMLSSRLHRIVSLAPSQQQTSRTAVEFTRLSTRALFASIDILRHSLQQALTLPAEVVDVLKPWVQESLWYICAAIQHCFDVDRIPEPLLLEGVASLSKAFLTCGARPAISMMLTFLAQHPTLFYFIQVHELPTEGAPEICGSVHDINASTPLSSFLKHS